MRHPILIAVTVRRACKKFKPIRIPDKVKQIALEKYGIVIKD